MKETAQDSKVYSRALDRLGDRITAPSMDESMSRYARRVGMEAMMVFEDEVDAIRRDEENRLRTALVASREKFAFYAEQHHAKGTEDSTKKAIVNEQMVAMITLALGER